MPDDHLITMDETRKILRRAYRVDGEINIEAVLRRAASDQVKPVSEKGRMRPSMLVVVGSVMLFLIVASFVYFSFGERR